MRAACRAFPGRVAVGIDARDGYRRDRGLGRKLRRSRALDLALRFEDAGVAAIIYTDIGRDGMLTGLNLEQTRRPGASGSPTPVIASGGVGSLTDLARSSARPRRPGRG